jgi:hypothetical protein
MLQVGETELGFLVENNLIQAALLQSLSAMPNVETHYGAKVTGITLVCGGHIQCDEQISLRSTLGHSRTIQRLANERACTAVLVHLYRVSRASLSLVDSRHVRTRLLPLCSLRMTGRQSSFTSKPRARRTTHGYWYGKAFDAEPTLVCW